MNSMNTSSTVVVTESKFTLIVSLLRPLRSLSALSTDYLSLVEHRIGTKEMSVLTLFEYNIFKKNSEP